MKSSILPSFSPAELTTASPARAAADKTFDMFVLLTGCCADARSFRVARFFRRLVDVLRRRVERFVELVREALRCFIPAAPAQRAQRRRRHDPTRDLAVHRAPPLFATG